MKSQQGRDRLRTAVLLPLLALLSALAIAACGGSSSSSSSGSTTTSAASSTSTSGSGTSTAATGGSSAERTKLQACLKQHGVTLPAGGFGGGRPAGGYGGGAPGSGTTPTGTPPAGAGSGSGTNRKFTPPAGGGGFAGGNSKFAKALKACGASFGGGGFPRGAGGFRGGTGTPAHISATVLRKFVACVRKDGYPAMPEASATKNASGGLFPKRIESNPKFEQASKQCAGILQSAFRRPATGGTSTTTSG